jgi:holliday junction DNA helicase RuvA
MLQHLSGKLIEKSPVHAVIDVGGVGYFLQISLHTFGKLGTSEQVRLYTHLTINSNDFSVQLYGFADDAERDVFRKLISVSGIGPNTARMILSGSSTDEVKHMIFTKNVAGFKRIKGIGEKTAERIIIDLHDKIGKISEGQYEKVTVAHNTMKVEALAALTSLGLDKTKTEKIVDKIMMAQPEASLEDLIKNVLKQI